MFVALPNLDDRRWTDLVEEGRSLIPVYSPAWTDHNESDPGITIMELLAWITDGDVYLANRIPDAHVLAFLALIGIVPDPPVAATAAVQFILKATETAPLLLPATVELDAQMLDDKPGKFHLRNDIDVLPVSLSAVETYSGGAFRDATGDWTHAKPVSIFGPNPMPGDALYLGFDGTFHPGDTLRLYFEFQGEQASPAERKRIVDELESRMHACPPWDPCGTTPVIPPKPTLPPHHSARLVWEAQTQAGIWEALDGVDETRSMTLTGTVALTLQSIPPALRTGPAPAPLRYIRCRFVSGSVDAAPVAVQILENATLAEQSSPSWEEWPIAAGVVAIGTPPAPGTSAWVELSFDANGFGFINSLDFSAAPGVGIDLVVLAYKPASATLRGSLTVEAVRVGVGNGAPNQLYQLKGPELCLGSLSLYTLEKDGAKPWSRVESFVASGAADAHYVVDPGAAEVLFGDGQNGRVPTTGAPIVSLAHVTSGAAGNVAADGISALDPGPHNSALFDVGAAAPRLEFIRNPVAATGGTEAETLAHAEGRAALLVNESDRAVTLTDCETLAFGTPGTSIARAAAIANYCPGLQCYSAPGFITVVIVPHLPLGRPVPSAGLLAAVSAYLSRRRVIGTRIEVTGPDYLEVSVNASVKAAAGQNKTSVRDAITAALQKFLDPLLGGPDGTGWPLGRGVYVSEILQTIAEVPGVDHVTALELDAGGCGAQCGDICLNPVAVAISGPHQIQVN